MIDSRFLSRRPTTNQISEITKGGVMTAEDAAMSQNPYVHSTSSICFRFFVRFNLFRSREDIFCLSYRVVRDVLFGSRENVNFVLEIFRQAFLLPFSCSPAIRRTIAVYKDWIQKSVSALKWIGYLCSSSRLTSVWFFRFPRYPCSCWNLLNNLTWAHPM